MANELDLQLITFLSTLMATGFGVFLAIYFERRQKADEEKTHAKRLLLLLKDEIKNNHDYLNELDTELHNQVPFYSLRFVVWNSINPEITKLLREFNIMKDVAEFYYDLQVIDRMLNAYLLNWVIEKNPKKLKIELAQKMLLRISELLKGKRGKTPQTLMYEIDCLIKNY